MVCLTISRATALSGDSQADYTDLGSRWSVDKTLTTLSQQASRVLFLLAKIVLARELQKKWHPSAEAFLIRW